MTTRDEIVKDATRLTHAVMDRYGIQNGDQLYRDFIEFADRILALLSRRSEAKTDLPPREPTPAMVEAMARAIDPIAWMTGAIDGPEEARERQEFRQQSLEEARAAWAAGYAKGEER